METLIILSALTNPDVSGGLPSWLNPLQTLTNLSATVVLALSTFGFVLAAGMLAVGSFFNIRGTKIITGIIGAVAAVPLALNAGTVLTFLSGGSPAAEPAAQAAALALTLPIF